MVNGHSVYSLSEFPGHTSLAEGEPVIMAGHFEVDDTGELSEFSRWSGHYMPEETPGYTSLERIARAAFARFGLPQPAADAWRMPW